MSQNTKLLLVALFAVAGLILLIARFKLNAFIALMLASLFVGICSGMKLSDVPKSFLEGVGKVLGDIAVVIGLGTILGKMLAESGGAEVVANRLVRALGKDRLDWAMMFVAFIVGIPVFFAVGLVLLVPIVLTLVRETRTPLLGVAIPLVAGLSVVHGLVPPHPGPVAAMGIFNELAGKADMGKTILYSLVIGLPTAIIAGPLFGKWISRKVEVGLPGAAEQLTHEDWEAWARRGADVCKAVYGRAYHKLLLNMRALHPALEDLVLVDAYGKVIGRPGLDLKRRELCTVATIAVLGAAQQLHSHLRGALNTGATRGEVEAVLAVIDGDLDAERRRSAHVQWEDVRQRKL